MTSTQQRAALQRQIWQIANEVRGAVDGWDFKQYVLGTLFYRFISENFASYIEGGDDSIFNHDRSSKTIGYTASRRTATDDGLKLMVINNLVPTLPRGNENQAKGKSGNG